MKKINTKMLGLLGLLGALAINSSQLWDNAEAGSGDFASSTKTIEDCIQKAMNKSHYKRNLFKCVDEDRGIEVTAKLRGTKRNKDGKGTVEGVKSVSERFEGTKKTKAEIEADKKSIEKVKTLEATITVARMVDPDCDDCGKKLSSATLYRDTGENGTREDFSDNPDMMASQLLEQVQDLMEVVDTKIKDQREKNREEDNKARKYKMCIADEDGKPFKDDFDKNFCVSEQLSNLEGEELKHFLNTRFAQHYLTLQLTNPEAAAELYGQLKGHERGGLNGLLINRSKHAIDQFSVLKARYDQNVRNAQYEVMRDPNLNIHEEMAKIGQYFGDEARRYIGGDLVMHSMLGQQLNAFETTLRTGVPPTSLITGDTGSTYSNYLNSGSINSEYLNSGTPYTSPYTAEMARRSLGFDANEALRGVYPNYDRSSASTINSGYRNARQR